MRCRTVPFTQGTVQAIASDGKTLDLLVDAGYPIDDLLAAPTTGYAFTRATNAQRGADGLAVEGDGEGGRTGAATEPTTRNAPRDWTWKPGTDDYGIASATRIDGRLLRLTLAGPLRVADRGLAVGDKMAFRGPGAQDVMVEQSSQITLDGLTIRGGSGFCIHESGGMGANVYRNITLTYPQKPEAASAEPLIASNADALHSGGVRRGPVVENCRFEGMCDDGIAIHGYYAMVTQATPEDSTLPDGRPRVLKVAFQWDNAFFLPGDPLRLFNPQGALVAETRVEKVTRLPDAAEPSRVEGDTRFMFTGHLFSVITADPLPADVGAGYRISSPAANGNGFVLRKNVIQHHRARGILIKASDGLIENNRVEGSTIAGLLIAPEFYWAEACYSRNLVIRNNLFRHCGYAHTGPWNPHAGTVTINGEGDQASGIGYGHRNILIENNGFDANDGCNLQIDGVQGITVRGNIFTHALLHPTERGKDREIDPGCLIFVRKAKDVAIRRNKVEHPGPAMRNTIGIGPNVAIVRGQDGGVKIDR